jgi:SPP1 family phage portal protein
VTPYFEHRKELYKRYTRKSSPVEMMNNEDERIVVAFEYYIVNMARGYFSGKPPIYTVAESEGYEEYQEKIDRIRRYNDDAAKFTKTIEDYLITGDAYMYITENEDSEIVYVHFDTCNTEVIYDFGTPPYPVAAIRVWTEDEDSKIEIITDNKRRIYDIDGEPQQFVDFVDGQEMMITEKELHWDDVPITPFKNPHAISIFEPAIGIIDTYESVLTNIRNTSEYNDKPKLIVSGYESNNRMFIDAVSVDGKPLIDQFGNAIRIVNPAWKQEEKELFDARALFINNDGHIDWLSKNGDYTSRLDLMNAIVQMITMTTNIPNMSDESFGRQQSGVAMGYKLYALDQYAAMLEGVFKLGYLRLWEIITNRLNMRHQTNYDFRDIDVAFTRNIPTDRDKEVERAVKAMESGISSRVTAIAMSGIDVDPESEEIRIIDEKRRIVSVKDVIDLFNAGLLDRETAIQQIFREDESAEIMSRLVFEDTGITDHDVEEEAEEEVRAEDGELNIIQDDIEIIE